MVDREIGSERFAERKENQVLEGTKIIFPANLRPAKQKLLKQKTGELEYVIISHLKSEERKNLRVQTMRDELCSSEIHTLAVFSDQVD